MLNRCYVMLAVLTLLAPLRGQDDGPIKMTPEFCFTMPLAQNGKDVTVKYPVLINPSTILKPGMKLRVLYMLANQSRDSTTDLALAHQGTTGEAYARDPAPSTNGKSPLPPEIAHEVEKYRRTIWEVSNNFVLAMAQYPTDEMHLIYQPNSDNRNITDDIFSFFDGLFIGLPNGKVTVLAVEDDSKANRAGLKAGDEIVAVGGISTHDDLSMFASAYSAAKRTAKVNNASTYAITIRSGDKGETRTLNIAMPATLKSSLFDGM